MERNMLATLQAWKKQKGRKPLVLRGVRQVGKTFLLQYFGKHDFPQYHYFNFEEDEKLKRFFEQDLKPDRILTELQHHSQHPINPATDLLILDEIQECPKALTSLKYFHEYMPELALCCAGSLIGVHLTKGSFPVGKVEIIDMYPMTFFEFLAAINEKEALSFLQDWTPSTPIPLSLHMRLWERLKWYFDVGGLPEVVQTFVNLRDNQLIAFEKVRNKQEQLLIGYIADIAKHSGKANAMHVERVLRAIPGQLSKSQDGSIKRFQFKGVIPKVDKYSRIVNAIDWLETTHLILKIHIANKGELPLSAFTKESWFKLLIFDVGILGAMSSLAPKTILDYDYGTYKGYFAENFVAQELVCAGSSPLYSWEESRAEVEFLIDINGQLTPIEVKSGQRTKAQSLHQFRRKYSPQTSIILSAKEFAKGEGLLSIPLYLAEKIPTI